MRKKRLLTIGIVLLTISFFSIVLAQGNPQLTPPGMPEQVKKAIEDSLKDPKFAQRTNEVIKPGAKQGYLGIPGAPYPNLLLALLWAIWVGWVFSSVGAFGGIMAGVGHLSVFGFGGYAKSFGTGHPVNKLITDSIRVSNQWLVGLSGLISSFTYYRMRRLVAPLALSLAIGGIGGSWLIPVITAGKISLKAYLGWFGIAVLVIGGFMLYDLTPRGAAKKKEAKAAAQAFEKAVKEKADTREQGVRIIAGSSKYLWIALLCVLISAAWINFVGFAKWIAYIFLVAGWILTFFVGRIRFTFFGQEFGFTAWVPMLGGIVIAAISSFLGVGGGFLYVPFLTSIAGLPMFLVAGTSALAVLVSMIISILTYMVGKSIVVSWGLIGVELIGIFIGSILGPVTSRYIPDKILKLIFVLLALYVGLSYVTLGFFGKSILPAR